MDTFLDYYGELPEVIANINIDVSNEEMCFVQYIPVRLPMQKISHVLPDNLKWCNSLIEKASTHESIYKGNTWEYIYLTVKRLYGVGNRHGWHCDGFGSDDINYIWYDSHPTKFYDGNLLKLVHDHGSSMLQMSEILYKTNKIKEYPCKSLLRMNQSSIHKVNEKLFTGLRTFVKISFSNEMYNLKGNAHNYKLDYNWDMVERSTSRNHPSK